MNNVDTAVVADRDAIKGWLAEPVSSEGIEKFKEGPGIKKLAMRVDAAALHADLQKILDATEYHEDKSASGFSALPMTRKPGTDHVAEDELCGRYWARTDQRYVEEAYEPLVDESQFSELIPDFKGTAFETVYNELTARFQIGRVRILCKGLYNCNSWHRDPEPRIHIPIYSNPGSLFVVNHHVTHLPADGSVYFTDTRGYHTALNGGFEERIHLVAALPEGFIGGEEAG